MAIITDKQWEQFISRFPNVHLLQTRWWGELKSEFGWEVVRITHAGAGAQILLRRLPLGYRLAYIPKGPVGGMQGQGLENLWDSFWPAVDEVCRERKVVFLKVEPDLQMPEEISSGQLLSRLPGFRPSQQSIQPPRTLIVDLTGDEEQVLGRMKQKTRYNIRLALKKGVVVRPCSDFSLFQRLMQITGDRDGFGVHSQAYHQRAYEIFYPRGQCEFLLAEYQGDPLAALMVFSHGKRAWFFYGASANEHRERMPTYLLQWEAMRWARAQGCSQYDLWGVPDADEATLEASFAHRSGGLWGVYRFKRGFGGRLCRSPGPWDRVYQPGIYFLYRLWAGSRKEAVA